MVFSKNLLAVLLAVAAVGVNGSPTELEKRKTFTTELCPDYWVSPGQTQACLRMTLEEGECHDPPEEYNDWAASIVLSPRLVCDLYQ